MSEEDEERRILFYQFCKRLCYKSDDTKWHLSELAGIFQNLHEIFSHEFAPNQTIKDAQKYMNSDVKNYLKEYLNSLKE
jgi:hypothetical protein